MSPVIFLFICCLLIIASSMLGGIMLASMRITHTRLQLFVSFIAGLMLGVALLHLLPMAVEVIPDTRWAFVATLLGLLVMFFLIRIFDCHEHSTIESEGDQPQHTCEHHDHAHEKSPKKSSTMTWMGLAVGLSIHSILDGFALAAAINAESEHLLQWGGLGIMLAIVLHKPLDSMMVTSMMIAQGSSKSTILTTNVLFALTCPIGAIMLWMGLAEASYLKAWILGVALAFSAGVFLCISLGDLLPELHFHKHDRLKLSAMLVLGVVVAFGIEMLHTHETPDQQNQSEPSEMIDASETQSSHVQPCLFHEPIADSVSSNELISSFDLLRA